MKGNSSVHTTNQKYRDGYDAIDWGKPKASDFTYGNNVELVFSPDQRPVPGSRVVLDPDTVRQVYGDLLESDGETS